MKTAEEILISEFKAGNCDDITTNPSPDFRQPLYQDIILLMKVYGGLLAKQTLKEAAQNFNEAYFYKNLNAPYDSYLEAILSTPIKTK